MKKELKGCCSKFYKNILLSFNILIFLVGLAVFIFAAILKWDPKLLNIQELEKLTKLTQIESITIFFLVLGAFIILVSLIGLLGFRFLNKFLLYVYEVIIIMLFLSHAIALLVLVFDRSTIEKEITKSIDKVVDDLNAYPNATNYMDQCDVMLGLSVTFSCCGKDGPNDFNSTSTVKSCCDGKTTNATIGCNTKIIEIITDKPLYYLIVPSCAVLGVELIVIIFTPFIIKNIIKS
jgi:small-conductance mechanosensitive channel